MKKLIFTIGIAIGMMACQTEEDPTTSNHQGTTNNNTGNTTFNPAGQTLLVQGKLQGSGSYTVSGDVKVYEDKDKKRSLVFENFSTSAGPDLRIYLAEDKSVTGFVEISNMVKNGNAVFSLSANIDLQKKNHVLIWCKKFAVLFGSAQLK